MPGKSSVEIVLQKRHDETTRDTKTEYCTVGFYVLKKLCDTHRSETGGEDGAAGNGKPVVHGPVPGSPAPPQTSGYHQLPLDEVATDKEGFDRIQ